MHFLYRPLTSTTCSLGRMLCSTFIVSDYENSYRVHVSNVLLPNTDGVFVAIGSAEVLSIAIVDTLVFALNADNEIFVSESCVRAPPTICGAIQYFDVLQYDRPELKVLATRNVRFGGFGAVSTSTPRELIANSTHVCLLSADCAATYQLSRMLEPPYQLYDDEGAPMPVKEFSGDDVTPRWKVLNLAPHSVGLPRGAWLD
jgi:hypothetical protein